MTQSDSSKKTFRVLVVEDNPHVSEIFRYAFKRIVAEKLGDEVEVEVAGATDGHQAWSKLEETLTTAQPFDLVILDLMLPVLDGTEVLARVRANETLAPLPVIVITAGDEDACREARSAGATEVLRKPVQFAQIREVVGVLL
ncbi:MAG: response regulator [Deltaproteobacteria bacterium]|nr:response regulator [Deltaproteobacteria bacterium]